MREDSSAKSHVITGRSSDGGTSRRARVSWRLLHTPAAPGVDNMALDEALLERARRTHEFVLRVYSWSRPTLSLGRHQRARGVYQPALARRHGVDVVRRITGGRAVLHWREITYSVTGPIGANASLHAMYRRINALLLHALHALGVPAAQATPSARTPAPASAPCFELPVTGELVLDGRKLVGSAQLREDGALLQHGSLLVDDDQGLVARLADTPVGVVAAAATLRGALGRAVTPEEFASRLLDAVRRLEDDEATPLVPDADLVRATGQARRRYAGDDWTWRR